ncbi:MAG: hypothetical protein JW934_05360 [Anaerolineae bacterium]|nr:hypothetical protein [Anaerolineae bacterium]
MTDTVLEYALDAQGYIHNWLVAGPQAIPVQDFAQFDGSPDQVREQIAVQYHRAGFDLHEPPLEWAGFEIDGVKLEWRYGKCRGDHFLNLSSFYPAAHYLRAWAYAEVMLPDAGEFEFALATNGPADVWINRRRAHAHIHPQVPQRVSFAASMNEGKNEILVRFEMPAVRECPYLMALQINGAPEGVKIGLPVQHGNLFRRLKLELVYDEVHLEHLVVTGAENLCFTWDQELEEEDQINFWVRDAQEHVKVAGWSESIPGQRTQIGGRQVIFDQGSHELVLFPPAHVIERSGIRYNESLPFYILETPFSEVYYGTNESRRDEALNYAVRREGDLYAEIAKLALNEWGQVDQHIVVEAVERIRCRQVGSVTDLVGLLGVLHRYPRTWAFSTDLKLKIQDCVIGFRYWCDEPGRDVMDLDSESHAILFHTCEILAGQLYPDQVFDNSGLTGRQHREKGEQLALDWLRECGAKGFTDWDSPVSFEEILLALSHLADLTENEELAELAAVVVDKLFFTMAVNSFKGAFGSTHGRADTAMVKSAQLEATSGIARLMWGMGVWNEHIGGLVALACSDYELPTMIASIAVDLGREMWHREHHPGVDKATYRTPDFMLCSAQSYRPGKKGDREHIWQATLGRDAVVFATHPPHLGEHDAQRPNFWCGNAILPRVVQWKDVLVAVHNLSQKDAGQNTSGMGFTHAYFPVYEFDEYAFEDGWAFARKGDGYLALRSSAGFELIHRGPGAFRELRAYGSEQVWVCMAGRKAVDGPFEQFKSGVKALKVDWDGLDVRLETLRGETISFDWQGDLRVDGKPQTISDLKHYDGPNCVAGWPCEQMDVRYGDYAVRLRFDV